MTASIGGLAAKSIASAAGGEASRAATAGRSISLLAAFLRATEASFIDLAPGRERRLAATDGTASTGGAEDGSAAGAAIGGSAGDVAVGSAANAVGCAAGIAAVIAGDAEAASLAGAAVLSM